MGLQIFSAGSAVLAARYRPIHALGAYIDGLFLPETPSNHTLSYRRILLLLLNCKYCSFEIGETARFLRTAHYSNTKRTSAVGASSVLISPAWVKLFSATKAAHSVGERPFFILAPLAPIS